MTVHVQKLVELEDLFPNESYEHRLAYIKDYNKIELLKLLSSINCFPGKSINCDYSEDEHEMIIEWLFKPDYAHRDAWIRAFIGLANRQYFPPVFHRAANLIALEEILMSDLPEQGGSPIADSTDIENVLKYYLSINSFIIQEQKFIVDNNLNEVETFISGFAPTNEFNLPFYPTEDAVRYQLLINHLTEHETYGEHVNQFFKKIGVSSKMYGIWGLKYIISIQQTKMIHPPICVASNKTDTILLNHFSNHSQLNGISPIEALNIKKNPFYKIEDGKFLLLDIQFMIDKSYHSLINDLWFDVVKPAKISRKKFMGEIGYFFEEHIGNQFKLCHPHWVKPPILTTDELERKIGKQKIELADVYVRNRRKVLVGQVKVSALNSKDKYTYEEGGVFKLDKSKFYKTFGLTQLVDTTIDKLVSDPILFDEKFPNNGDINVYPTLVVNERLLLNPAINLAFQKEFLDLLGKHFGNIQLPSNSNGVAIIDNRYHIHPVVILYVADVEILQLHVSEREYYIWDVIDWYYSEYGLLAPFSKAVNDKIGIPYLNHLRNEVLQLLKPLASRNGCVSLPFFLLKWFSNLIT